MIGLTFLAVAAAWLALSIYVAKRVPKWLGVKNLEATWLIGGTVLAILLIGPFVDHIVGMRQFERLCVEQTNVKISPNADKTKRGTQKSSTSELLAEYAVPIERSVGSIVDLDTGEVIASYNNYSTKGGVVGGAVMLGGLYACNHNLPVHADYKKYMNLLNQIKLSYGDEK